MSKNRILLSVVTVVAALAMLSETASAQLFSGRRASRRNQCCQPAPAPCCATPAPAPAPCCGAAPAPVAAPAPCCGGVAAATAAPVYSNAPLMSAPAVTSSCCGGGTIVSSPMMSEGTIISSEMAPAQGVVSGETILESGEVAGQQSPSDSTVTSGIVEPPAGSGARGSATKAAMDAIAPGQDN